MYLLWRRGESRTRRSNQLPLTISALLSELHAKIEWATLCLLSYTLMSRTLAEEYWGWRDPLTTGAPSRLAAYRERHNERKPVVSRQWPRFNIFKRRTIAQYPLYTWFFWLLSIVSVISWPTVVRQGSGLDEAWRRWSKHATIIFGWTKLPQLNTQLSLMYIPMAKIENMWYFGNNVQVLRPVREEVDQELKSPPLKQMKLVYKWTCNGSWGRLSRSMQKSILGTHRGCLWSQDCFVYVSGLAPDPAATLTGRNWWD